MRVVVAGILLLILAVVLWGLGEREMGGVSAAVGIILIGASDPPTWHGGGPIG
jgi:uncharacterized membrane protein